MTFLRPSEDVWTLTFKMPKSVTPKMTEDWGAKLVKLAQGPHAGGRTAAEGNQGSSRYTGLRRSQAETSVLRLARSVRAVPTGAPAGLFVGIREVF